MSPPRPEPSRIDRPARDAAAGLIDRLLDDQITEIEFQGQFPQSPDPAIREAYLALAGAAPFERVKLEQMTGHDPRSGALRFERWRLFLRSDTPFAWPPPPPLIIGPLSVVVGGCFFAGGAWLMGVLIVTNLFRFAGEMPGYVTILIGILAVGGALWFVGHGGRTRRSILNEWSRWMASGDAGYFPFRNESELRACGADPEKLRSHWSCPSCGYDLGGIVEPGCPECGLGRSASKAQTPRQP